MNKMPLCQRCRLPLVPHESLLDLRQAQIGLLTGHLDDPDKSGSNGTGVDNGKVTGSEGGSGDDDVVAYSKLHPNSATTGNFRRSYGGSSPGESFVLLTESLMASGNSLMYPSDEGVSGNGNGLAMISTNKSADANGSTGNNRKSTTNVSKESRSKRIFTLENLFQELSGQSDIDYPICTDCAELIQDHLRPRYEESCKERDTYISFLNKIKDVPGPGSEEVEEMLRDIQHLETESEEALLELKKVEQKRLEAEQELLELQKESEALTLQEEQFYKEQNRLYRELADSQNEKDRIDSLHNYHTTRLHKLQRINVYNDTFCIGHDGYFGTINGLRLGRLEKHKVGWPEINAAWGQTLLLMASVIQKFNFKLVGYRLRPLGSKSKIEKFEVLENGQTTEPVVLELYSSGEYTFERLLKYTRVDAAMVEFLNILDQVGKFVASSDPALKPPYEIDQDKIGEKSIKLSIKTTDQTWTDACKYVLTNAKWILAYASTR